MSGIKILKFPHCVSLYIFKKNLPTIFHFFADASSESQAEFKLGSASEKDAKIQNLVGGLQSLIKGEVTGQHTSLTCRSIRIGSYKTLAKEKVHFTQKAIYIRVPYLTAPTKMITIVIPASDILRIGKLISV